MGTTILSWSNYPSQEFLLEASEMASYVFYWIGTQMIEWDPSLLGTFKLVRVIRSG